MSPTTPSITKELAGTAPAPDAARWARLQDGLTKAADAAGVLDVAYADIDSPLGPLTVAATPTGVVRIAFANEDHDAVLGELADRVSPRVLEAPGRLDAVRHELDRYFAGELTRFDVPLDWSLARGFRAEALAVCARIPYGSTRTYLAIAAEAGNPKAVRAVGSAMGTNPIPVIVPCHRVLRTDGGLGGYRGGLAFKELLLELEGAEH